MSSSWSWKIPCILQVALPCYQIVTIWLCPESPRWLLLKDRLGKARSTLIKYHGEGVETELVQFELQEILAGIEADKSRLKFNKDGFHTIIASKGALHRLWICAVVAVASQCAGSTLISTYLPQILDQVGFSTARDKTLINGLVNIASYVVAIVSAFVIPRVRRRLVFLSATGAMLLVFVIWTALAAEYTKSQSQGVGIGVVAMVFIFNIIYCACWLPLVIAYPLEICTTKQRGVFFSWTYFCITASATIVSHYR